MKTQPTESTTTSAPKSPSDEAIAIHVLYRLTTHQMNGARIRFDALRRMLPVRRMELARVLARLDRQGLIDAARLSLTLHGFAIGMSLREADLPVLREATSDKRARAA